jgi:hypothetical protein
MATPRGLFAPELLPEGWFDETLRPEGWFSQDFLEPTANGGAINASASQLIENVTLSATSTLGGGAINATANQTLENITQSAAAKIIIAATANQTVGNITLSASADVLIGASAGQTIGAVTQSATADLLISAAVNQNIANVTLASGATLSGGAINATSDQTIEAVTLSATVSLFSQENAISGGSYGNLFKPPRRKHVDDEEKEEKLPTARRIGDAPRPEIQTGIIDIPAIKRSTQSIDTIAYINKFRGESETAQRERIKRIVAADDDWLMTA